MAPECVSHQLLVVMASECVSHQLLVVMASECVSHQLLVVMASECVSHQLLVVLQGPESNVIRRNRGEKPVSSADAGGGTVEGDYSSYKEAKENLCLSLLFVSNEKDADRDSLDIQ
jgi:hypothetical protein